MTLGNERDWCELFRQRLIRGETLPAERFIEELGQLPDADLLAQLREVEKEVRSPATNDAHCATQAMSPEETPTTVIGRYRLLQKLGEGGMGIVYLAEQTVPISRRVALKIIKPGMDSRQVIARFEAERQALALMDHPNIARVFDAGLTTDGRPYFVMELVKGQPITQYCDEKRLSIPERLQLFETIGHAVQHAHLKGVIHRESNRAQLA